MGNENSVEKINMFKAKTFRKNFERTIFSQSEYSQNIKKPCEAVEFVLHNGVVSTYLDGNLENSIEANQDLAMKLSRNKLLLAIPQGTTKIIWKLQSSDPDTLQHWGEALKLSKRPRYTEGSQCQICQKKFTSIRRKHHCRSCGKILCNSCSKSKILLKSLGYNTKKRICEECKEKNLSAIALFQSKQPGKYP